MVSHVISAIAAPLLSQHIRHFVCRGALALGSDFATVQERDHIKSIGARIGPVIK